MKTRISEAEQLQLIGLLTLAAHHEQALKDIHAAACALLGITDVDAKNFNNPADHVSDAVYGDRTPTELLHLLDVTVGPDGSQDQNAP